MSIKQLIALSMKIKKKKKIWHVIGEDRNYVQMYFNDILDELDVCQMTVR